MISSRMWSAVLLVPFLSVTAVSAQRQTVSSPPIGSAVRRAILDALRAELGVESRFQVHHLKTTSRWAYLRAGEIVDQDGEQQETDLSVAALLEREPAGGTWRVLEFWTLPGEAYQSFSEFTRLVHERQRQDSIPAALFPPGL